MIDSMGARSVRITQAVWLMIVLATAAAWLGGAVPQWRTLATVCYRGASCHGLLDAASARALGQYGISPTGFTMYTFAVLALLSLIWYSLAALIIWRKADDRGAVVAAFFLVIFPLTSLANLLPPNGPLGIVWFIAIPAFPLFGLLFPGGRFTPPWTRWLAVACVITTFLTAVVVWPLLLALIAVVAVDFYRYRSIFTWSQRQQAKWAFFGLMVAILGLVVLVSPVILVPRLVSQGSLYSAFTTTAVPLVTSAIPMFIAIAVLRNRLWDIDRLINRTLVYALLTGTLAAIYLGSVIGLQALSRLVVGNSSALAIALSTLAIAALFGPLRRRIQTGIDRRFYRRKYDAERILAAFGDRVHDEVDLSRLSQDLTSVVHDTLQPEHVSLWLRPR